MKHKVVEIAVYTIVCGCALSLGLLVLWYFFGAYPWGTIDPYFKAAYFSSRRIELCYVSPEEPSQVSAIYILLLTENELGAFSSKHIALKEYCDGKLVRYDGYEYPVDYVLYDVKDHRSGSLSYSYEVNYRVNRRDRRLSTWHCNIKLHNIGTVVESKCNDKLVVAVVEYVAQNGVDFYHGVIE